MTATQRQIRKALAQLKAELEANAATIAEVLEGPLPGEDPCPRCGGDHDRIDRRDPCPGEMRIVLDGVEVGRGIPEGQAPYVYWHRVRLTTELTVPSDAKARYEFVPADDGARVDFAPAFRLEPVRPERGTP